MAISFQLYGDQLQIIGDLMTHLCLLVLTINMTTHYSFHKGKIKKNISEGKSDSCLNLAPHPSYPQIYTVYRCAF